VSAGTDDCGSPVAYLVLEVGTAVYASDGSPIGTVEHVLFVPEEDVFEGIVVATADGPRFVERDDVDRIFERCVFTTLTEAEARSLPAPDPGAPAYHVDPALAAGSSLRDHYLRLFRKGGWLEEPSGERELEQEEKERKKGR
jgi:hypothetical protein